MADHTAATLPRLSDTNHVIADPDDDIRGRTVRDPRIRGIQPHGEELLVYVRDMEHPVASVQARRTPHRRTLQALAMHLVTEPGLSQRTGLQSNEPR